MNGEFDRGPLYTLEQVAERSGIHRMLLESYLHSASWRVPTVWVAGEERYPREALNAFQEMHEEAQRASAPVESRRPAEGDGPSWGRRRLLSLTAQRRNASARGGEAAIGDGNGRAEDSGPRRQQAPPIRSAPAIPEVADAAETVDVPQAAGGAEAVATEDAPEPAPTAAPRRPSRPLYTLQQVHDHTGIPYPVLALYAASEAGRIPSAGERYAPLYPWEALAVFCRIHLEKNPSWPAPALPPTPPSVEDEAAARELSARLERLERAQSDLSDQIRSLLEEDEQFLPATVPQDRPTA